MCTEDGTEEMLDLISAPDTHERTHFNTNEGTHSVYDTMCSLLRGHIMLYIEECKENNELTTHEHQHRLPHPTDLNQKA